MYLMKSGHMIVRSHEKKEDVLIHPLGIKKFVTFSSWTLILNVMYFSCNDRFVLSPSRYRPVIKLVSTFSRCLRYCLGSIIPDINSCSIRYIAGNYSDEEHHKRQFWFHNQMMHNFCKFSSSSKSCLHRLNSNLYTCCLEFSLA